MQRTKIMRQRAHGYRLRGKWYDFACALPALVFFAVFTYYPVINLLQISFTDWNLMRDSYEYVGFKNYAWLFSGSGLRRLTSSLSVTLLYTLGEVVCSCFLGLMLALLFSRMSRSFKIMRTLVVLPKYVTISASAMVFLWLYNESYGILNQFYAMLGVQPVNWLGSEKTALLSVIIFSVWRSVGYAMLIYLGAIKGLNPDYYEAASLDGASGFQRFRYITMPLIAPTTLFLGVTTFLASMKVFQTIELLTEGGPYQATNVTVYWIYDLAFKSYRLDRAAAVGIVFFVILLVFTIITMRWSENKVNYDA